MNETINEFGYKRNIPIIFAGAFEKITGGIMIRIDHVKNLYVISAYIRNTAMTQYFKSHKL